MLMGTDGNADARPARTRFAYVPRGIFAGGISGTAKSRDSQTLTVIERQENDAGHRYQPIPSGMTGFRDFRSRNGE
jgi:hypothetical protein